MKKPLLVFSDMAVADILEQADWYRENSGITLARRWDNAVTSVLLRAVRNPASGTPCIFRSADLRNVRRIPIVGFPKHLMFYRFLGTEILILRVVHGARDLEKLF